MSGTHKMERRLKAITLSVPLKRLSSSALVVRIASPASITFCTMVRLMDDSLWLMDSCSQLRAIRMTISPRSSRNMRNPRSASVRRMMVSITVWSTSSISSVELTTCPIPASACRWLKRCSNGASASLIRWSEVSRVFNSSRVWGVVPALTEARIFSACLVTAITWSLIVMAFAFAVIVAMKFPLSLARFWVSICPSKSDGCGQG